VAAGTKVVTSVPFLVRDHYGSSASIDWSHTGNGPDRILSVGDGR